jgi:hypothetical protein
MKNLIKHSARENIWNGTNFVGNLPKDYKGVELPCIFIRNDLRLPANSNCIIDATFDEIYQGEAYFIVTKVYDDELQTAVKNGIVDVATEFVNNYLISLRDNEIITNQVFLFEDTSFRLSFKHQKNSVFGYLFAPTVGKVELGYFDAKKGYIPIRVIKKYTKVIINDNSTYNSDGGIVYSSSTKRLVDYYDIEKLNIANGELSVFSIESCKIEKYNL